MKRTVGFIHLVAWLALCHAALAAEPEAKRQAQQRFAAGLRSYDAAEQKHDPQLYEEAYLQFAQAYAIYPDDKVLWNLAVCEVDTGRYLDAVRHFDEYEEHQHVSERPADPKYEVLRGYRDRLRLAIGRIAVSAPPGARLRVDGREVGVAPLPEPIAAMPGDHVVEAEIVFESKRQSISPLAGDTVRVQFPAPPPLARDERATPVAATTLPPAPPAPPPPPAESESPRQTWWTTQHSFAVGFGAVALLEVGAGIYLRVASQAAASSVYSMRSGIAPGACASATAPPVCRSLQDKIDAANRDATLSSLAFVIAGASVAGIIAMLIPNSHDATVRTGTVTWRPALAPAGAALRADF